LDLGLDVLGSWATALPIKTFEGALVFDTSINQNQVKEAHFPTLLSPPLERGGPRIFFSCLKKYYDQKLTTKLYFSFSFEIEKPKRF
jgi:hypothetical protein